MLKKTVLVTGNFNILHPGHLRLLKFARELGTELIVGVNSNIIGGNNIHITENIRLESVQSVSWVTKAFIIKEDIKTIINNIKPDIIVKGKEHENLFNEEMECLNAYGGELVFSSGELAFTSLDLIKTALNESRLSINYPSDFINRYGITKDRLITLVKNINFLKICVLGDLIIDEYITCEALGMSQEDPTIAVTPIDEHKYVGGAGIVAAHSASLGATVDFISVAGDDDNMLFAKLKLNEYHVNSYLFIDKSRPTTLKQRFRAKNKTLLRVSKLHQNSININLQNEIYDLVSKNISSYNLIIFSDFNYGVLPQRLVDRITEIAKLHNVKIAADSQSSSQVGDISRFKNADIIFPTEHEARISLRNHEDGIAILTDLLRKKSNSSNIILKLGEDGIFLQSNLSDRDFFRTDKIKALNLSPIDVAGAGDSMLASTSMMIAGGANLWEAAYVGSISSAIQVSKIGNSPIRRESILGLL
jgi:rfaE bifunctional protein kinase chain/domain